VPEKVREIESDIKRESRRWRIGVRAGAAFDPELFAFGVQSQIGPLASKSIVPAQCGVRIRRSHWPNSFELRGCISILGCESNGELDPYVGAGPAMIFIHQNYQSGRQIDFGNFDYETGLNVLAGVQSRKGTFVELKTSLYSHPVQISAFQVMEVSTLLLDLRFNN
jgi:hypothetical protein